MDQLVNQWSNCNGTRKNIKFIKIQIPKKLEIKMKIILGTHKIEAKINSKIEETNFLHVIMNYN